MFRRKEPATEIELQWERREKRLLAYLIGIPALLLLTFTAFYFTPWEISYRQHGVTVAASYSRNELCAPVLDYYRQIAPTHGWTYTRTVQRSSHTTVNDIDTTNTSDYYSGTFEGYVADLVVDCDLSHLGYEIRVSARSDLCFMNCFAQRYGPSSA